MTSEIRMAATHDTARPLDREDIEDAVERALDHAREREVKPAWWAKHGQQVVAVLIAVATLVGGSMLSSMREEQSRARKSAEDVVKSVSDTAVEVRRVNDQIAMIAEWRRVVDIRLSEFNATAELARSNDARLKVQEANNSGLGAKVDALFEKISDLYGAVRSLSVQIDGDSRSRRGSAYDPPRPQAAARHAPRSGQGDGGPQGRARPPLAHRPQPRPALCGRRHPRGPDPLAGAELRAAGVSGAVSREPAAPRDDPMRFQGRSSASLRNCGCAAAVPDPAALLDLEVSCANFSPPPSLSR